MVAKILLLGIAALVVAGPAASGCQGTGTPVLDDNFKTPDPGWGRPDSIADFTANGLVLRPPVDGNGWRTNRNYKLDGTDWCVEVTNPARLPSPADQQTVGDVGLWFWGVDNQNFYTATISLAGTFAVDRLVGGRWETVVAPTRAPAIKALAGLTAAGAGNQLEIVVNGDTAAFFVNGVRLAEFRGQAPSGGGSPGVYGESGPAVTTWVFTRARLF